VEIRRLIQLEDENRRLKRLAADPTLDKQMLQVKLDFSRPGKPTDNAYIELFNDDLNS